MIIRGRHAGNTQEGEEALLLGTVQEGPEVFRGREGKRTFADAVQFIRQLPFDEAHVRPPEFPVLKFLPHRAGAGAEIRHLITEDRDMPVLFPDRQERMLSADVFCIGDDMRQKGLPVAADVTVGGVPVAHQRAVKILTEDGLCRWGLGDVDVFSTKKFLRGCWR